MTHHRAESVRPARFTARPENASAAAPAVPGADQAEVRIIAASPEAARQVADVLRRHFAATEQRSYPADPLGGGTRLHLTVDTARGAEASGPGLPWPVPGHPHHDELPGVPVSLPVSVSVRPGHPTTPDEPSGDRPPP